MKTIKMIILLFALTFVSLALMSCAVSDDETAVPTAVPDADEPVELANPASVYCEEQGGKLEIRTDENGDQYGVCVFEDGSACEEWAFFRGECQPGQANEHGSESTLIDEKWVLQDLGQPLLPDSLITIEFTADGQVNGSAGCNSYFGNYTLDGDSLITGPIGSTQMWCEGYMDQESAFLQALQTATGLTVTETELIVHTPNGAMRFAPAENAALEGSDWVLSGIVQGDAVVNTWVDADITIKFNDGQVSGNAGCNSYSGGYQTDGESLALSELMSTMMACEEEISQRETEFLAALATVSQFRTEMNQLILTDSNGDAVLFFTTQG